MVVLYTLKAFRILLEGDGAGPEWDTAPSYQAALVKASFVYPTKSIVNQYLSSLLLILVAMPLDSISSPLADSSQLRR